MFLVSTSQVHVDTTACSIATTRLFREETLRGRGQSPILRARPSFFKRFARDYCESLLNMLSVIIAAVYAYITFSIQIFGVARMAVFMIGSLVLKISLQEAAKHSIVRHKVRSIAVMAVLVGTPTILIHTHMSIVMLRAQSLSSTLSGTLSTAILEIFMRVGKASLVKRKIRREAIRQIMILTDTKAKAQNAQDDNPTHSHEPQYQSALELEFSAWKMQLLHYAAAKIYVGMFAEYVALDCAYAVIVLFWNHPMFQLGDETSLDGALSHSLFKSSEVLSLILQIDSKLVFTLSHARLKWRKAST